MLVFPFQRKILPSLLLLPGLDWSLYQQLLCWHFHLNPATYAINCYDCQTVQNSMGSGGQEFVILNKVRFCFNFQGVKILDMISKQRITNVPRDDISLRPDMYPCSLCWKDNLTLIIGWGNSVKVQLPVFVINACRYHRQTEDYF